MKKWFSVILVVAMLLSAGCQMTQPASQSVVAPSGQLEVHYIDVDQADAILIKTPEQGNILIDGGGNSTQEALVSYIKQQGVKKLDAVIATHPHEDHIGGLDYVIQSFDVDQVYMPKVNHTTKTYENLLVAIKNKGLKVHSVTAGLPLSLTEGAVNGQFLAPNQKEYKDLNDYSAVLKLNYGATSFIFTGDAEALSEQEILAKYKAKDLQAQVLKLGHHGSSTSSSETFLKAVKPDVAIISCGKDNDYGHPHQETMDLLTKLGIATYRTDELGTIVVTSDGEQIAVGEKTVTANNSLLEEQLPQEPETVPETLGQGATSPAIVIQSVDRVAEKAVLKNTTDKDQSVGGWVLVSVQGDQRYTLPEDTIIPANGQLTIVSGEQAEAQGDQLLWGQQNIWNNKSDPAQLYDAVGQLQSTYE